jgi:hypoxanthine phosphoribosyltransferase
MSRVYDRRHLSWAQCASLTCTLADMARDHGPVDTVMAVSRGGLVPGALMATLLDMRDVVSTAIASYEEEERVSGPNFVHFPDNGKVAGRNVLIVDDVWDTGHTAVAVADRVRQAGGKPIVAVLHYKPGNSEFPDRKPELWVEETSDWIVYPWEREALAGAGGVSAGVGTSDSDVTAETAAPGVETG